jgi:predicted phage terminase large subunit-like protein
MVNDPIAAELARRHLVDFCALMDSTYERAAHLDLLAKHLEAIERREINKLIVCMPPRHGKSKTIAQDLPAWYLGRNPRHQIVLASYGSDLAEAHSRRVREALDHELYPFQTKVSASSSAVDRWETTAGGVVRAAGVGGALTGMGAHLLIIDDAVKDAASAESDAIRESTWNWYSTVARTRLMPRAAQILVGTRWHDDDLLGRVLNSPGASEWTKLILPALAEENDPLGRAVGEALWPAWYPAKSYPSIESGDISTRQFEALYQQRPVPAGGSIFKVEWFANTYAGGLPRRTIVEPTGLQVQPGVYLAKTEYDAPCHVVLAIDTASKTGPSNDWSVLATIASDEVDFFIVDIVRERLEFSDLVRKIIDTHQKYNHSRVYIEDASSGIQVCQELRRWTGLPVIPIKPTNTKQSRWESQTGNFEARRVRLPEHAHWKDALLAEFLAAPAGKHDDIIDAVVLGISQLDGVIANEQHAHRTIEFLRGWIER